jgi:hypothetical protein
LKRLVPDPLQDWTHDGKPLGGPARFIEVNCDPSYVSAELERQITRRRDERAAKDELDHYAANPPHRAKVTCPRCSIGYYEIGSSNGRCAVCIVELEHRHSFHTQLEDIHP